jgi:fatty acid synthase
LDEAAISLADIAKLVIHISLENNLLIKVKTVELVEETDAVTADDLLSPLIAKCLNDFPLIQEDISIINTNTKLNLDDLSQNILVANSKSTNTNSNVLVAMGHRLLTKSRMENLNLLVQTLKIGGFVITREVEANPSNIQAIAEGRQLDIIMAKKYKNEVFLLLKKRIEIISKISVVHVTNDKFKWIEDMRKIMTEELEKENHSSTRILFVGQGDFENGK